MDISKTDFLKIQAKDWTEMDDHRCNERRKIMDAFMAGPNTLVAVEMMDKETNYLRIQLNKKMHDNLSKVKKMSY